MRDVALSFIGYGILCSSAISSVATSADLYGQEVHLVFNIESCPLIEDTLVDLGNVIVGDGYEFQNVTSFYDYEDPDNPVLIGDVTNFLDITHNSIEYGRIFDNVSNGEFFIYTLPAEFSGWTIEFIDKTAPLIDGVETSMTSGAGYVGDLDLWQETNPKIEKIVDSLFEDPYSQERAQVLNSTTITADEQGVYSLFPANQIFTVTRVLHLEFSCEGDIDGSGGVDVHDLLALVAAWGDCPEPCSADINEDQLVNIHDLLVLIAAWGECP